MARADDQLLMATGSTADHLCGCRESDPVPGWAHRPHDASTTWCKAGWGPCVHTLHDTPPSRVVRATGREPQYRRSEYIPIDNGHTANRGLSQVRMGQGGGGGPESRLDTELPVS